jgi:8-amino-7-oxononanoate synthase
MSLQERWRSQLDALEGQGRLRTLQSPQGADFSSNDYLGYAKLEFAVAPASRSGAASRLLRGHHPIWEQVETELARWHGAEAALVLTCGYVANEGLLSTAIDEGDLVASDESNHASLIDGLKLMRPSRVVYRHLDLDHLESALRRQPARRGERFIVTESLFSMNGDVAPLEALVEIADRLDAHLIVDEAHATGCFGAAGSGLVDAADMRPNVLATVHTGGKALGLPGAYICCSSILKQLLINRCRHFIFTTALPPAVGIWWLDALARVRQDHVGRERLHANAALFRTELQSRGVAALGEHYVVPVILGEDAHALTVATKLQHAGFDIRAIRPPTVPEGTARLRISIHADHDQTTLCQLAAALAEAAA